MEQKMIKLIAFDLDGTIGDTIPLCIAAFQKAVSPFTGRNLTEEEIIQTFGLNEEGMIKQLIPEKWRQALDDFYRNYNEMHTMCPYPFDGIREIIEELKTYDISIVLITGKGKGSCDITLRQFEMENTFDLVVTGSPEKNIKAETLLEIQDKYNLLPDEMIYIGDTVSDVNSCKDAAIQCLSAAWAVSVNEEELEEWNKGYVFSSVQSLREYLMKLLSGVDKSKV